MSHEIPQAKLDAAWSILQSEGVYILPKRALAIPRPNQAKVFSTVGARKIRQAYEAFQIFDDFIRMSPIADKFNKDHHARVVWSGTISQRVGETVFKKLYEERNQLRLNVLSVPVLALVNLIGLIDRSSHLEIVQRLNEIEKQISDVFTGYHPITHEYDGMNYGDKELEEKLLVVQFMEDRCIDILNIFVK